MIPTKYLVIELQTNADGSVGNLVYSYDNLPQAEAKYHTVLAAAALSDLPAHAAVLMDNEGYVRKQECYYGLDTEQPA